MHANEEFLDRWRGQRSKLQCVPLQLHLQAKKGRNGTETGAISENLLKPWFSRKIIFHSNVTMYHKIYKKWTLKMCICMFSLLLYVLRTHTPLWDRYPTHPVIRHVCARLTDLSSNQTSFRLHLTPSPREQPPQRRSPGNHPLISEVSVCIIVFTLSSDTQSLAYSHTLLHGPTHVQSNAQICFLTFSKNIHTNELIDFVVEINIS